MWQLLFFIIFIFLIQGLSKILEREAKKRRPKEESVTEEEIEKYLETLGFPPIRIPKPKKEKPKIEERKIKASLPVVEEIREEEEPVLKEKIPEIEEKILPEFPPEKLEEGIILSEILGQPKAFRIRRSAWNR